MLRFPLRGHTVEVSGRSATRRLGLVIISSHFVTHDRRTPGSDLGAGSGGGIRILQFPASVVSLFDGYVWLADDGWSTIDSVHSGSKPRTSGDRVADQDLNLTIGSNNNKNFIIIIFPINKLTA